MQSLSFTKSPAILATALFTITLMSFGSTVSAQAPGGSGSPGMSGPHMGGQQTVAGPHMGGSGPHMGGGGHHQSHRAVRMMRLYDLNGDGKITIAEINADQARIFTALDVNDDKSMSVDEIKRRGRSLQIFRTTTLFDLLDANGDGKLSVAEVQAPSKRWFKRYDENGDGVMEADEIPGRHGHRGRGGMRGRR